MWMGEGQVGVLEPRDESTVRGGEGGADQAVPGERVIPSNYIS